MSPEQLEGKTADERSDQFSFCVSLAEALSGERPFKGDTLFELTQSLTEKPRFGSGISSKLRAVLRKGLELNPAHRFASMTALLNAIERADRRPWRTVGVTLAVVATIALGFFAVQRLRPAPLVVETPLPLAWVAVSAVDIEEGTIITRDMIWKKEMPAAYVSRSFITPDRTEDIVGQTLKVRLPKGDPLLWTHFPNRQWIVVFRKDLPAGTTLSRKLIEERSVPGELSSGDVVTSKDYWNSFGKKLLVDGKAGEPLHASMLERMNAEPQRPVGETLSDFDVEDALRLQKQEVEKCVVLKRSKPKVELRWNITPEGVPYDVESREWFRDDEPAVKCLIEMISKVRFPARPRTTNVTTWGFHLWVD